MVVEYKPYQERTPDTQYRQLLEIILEEGDTEPSPQEYDARMIFGHQMRFKLSNGFPMIPERDVYSGKYSIFNQALGELFAFLNGAQTQKELESFGCMWWGPWTSGTCSEHSPACEPSTAGGACPGRPRRGPSKTPCHHRRPRSPAPWPARGP